jgi:hypothetical protein
MHPLMTAFVGTTGLRLSKAVLSPGGHLHRTTATRRENLFNAASYCHKTKDAHRQLTAVCLCVPDSREQAKKSSRWAGGVGALSNKGLADSNRVEFW